MRCRIRIWYPGAAKPSAGNISTNAKVVACRSQSLRMSLCLRQSAPALRSSIDRLSDIAILQEIVAHYHRQPASPIRVQLARICSTACSSRQAEHTGSLGGARSRDLRTLGAQRERFSRPMIAPTRDPEPNLFPRSTREIDARVRPVTCDDASVASRNQKTLGISALDVSIDHTPGLHKQTCS